MSRPPSRSAPASAPLRVLPAPRYEPPYDDERPGSTWTRRDGCDTDEVAHTQGSLALSFQLPSGLPAIPEAPGIEPTDDAFFGRQRTPPENLPSPQAWATLLSQAAVEIVAGHRPVRQLLRWTTAAVYATLCEEAGHASAKRVPARQHRAVVRSVRVCVPAPGVAEASALVAERDRAWAMALRLEALDGRWRCTALGIV